MVTLHNFSNAMLKLGDKNSQVFGIKQFLHSHYKTGVSNLRIDSTFCEKTSEALLNFQKYKNLSQTGIMNPETWQAIGKELGIIRFEQFFFNTPNYKVVHKLAFGNKFSRLFPTGTHQLLVEYAFLEGGGLYGEKNGDIGGGLSKAEVNAIDYGSKLVDTYFGTGALYDIPITLLIPEAYKHAMIPEGMSVEDAMKKGHDWIIQNCKEARRIQRETDETIQRTKQNIIDLHQSGKPVPSSLPNPTMAAGGMNLLALTEFGKACHTYMDSESPAHHGWQEYKMPKKKVEIYADLNPMLPVEIEQDDWGRYFREGLQHKADESGEPTAEQKNNCVLYMRGAFLTTFTNRWFKRAVKTESKRQEIYDFLRSKGLTWSEDFWQTSDEEVRQTKIPRNNLQSL